jgi:lambda family phage tail tape measure protein
VTQRNLAIRLSVTDAAKVKATLNDVGESGQRAIRKVEDASRPASKALLALDGATGTLRGTFEGMTARLGPVGGALSRLGPAGLAAGAALGALTGIIAKGVAMQGEAERSYRRLEAVLNATGHAAGLTSRQITRFAEEMERTTLIQAEAVQEAAAVLATFRSVSGETFTRTIRLAQDMATVFGGTLQSSVTQLGKALEDPIQGLTALRRVGISFSASQRDVIKALVDTGREAEAQRVILDALEQQVGGAGAAEARGLTGATNRLSDAWGNFLEHLAATSGAAGTAQNALNAMAGVMERITGWFAETPLDARISEMETRIARTMGLLSRPGAVGVRGAHLRSRLEAQERELAELQRQRDEAAAKARTEEERAEAGRLAAEAERRAERVAALRADIEKEIAQFATAAERRLAIDRSYAEKRQQLEAQRTEENSPEIDAALARAAELHRRQLASLETRHKASAAVIADTNARLIEQMTQQLTTLGDERRQFIDQALSRLSEKATAAQRIEVERLAGALYDQKKAQEAAAEAQREGLRLAQQLLTPTEAYAQTIARLAELLDRGAISQETFNRAMADADTDFAAAKDRLLRDSREWEDGMTRALGDYLDEATNAAKGAEAITVMAFQSMEDALTSMVVKGKLDFRSLADSIVADITRIAVKQAILAPLAGWMAGGGGTTAAVAGQAAGAAASAAASSGTQAGGFFSKILASIFHEGGVVGEGTPAVRRVDASVFLDAPRYHIGGVTGLKPNEVPAILQRGEVVLSRSQVARRMDEGARPPVNVIMNISTPDTNGFRASQGQIAADAARTIARAQRRFL